MQNEVKTLEKEQHWIAKHMKYMYKTVNSQSFFHFIENIMSILQSITLHHSIENSLPLNIFGIYSFNSDDKKTQQ